MAVDDYGPASYGDALADVYDDWYADGPVAQAVADAVANLAAGAPVLELGIGSGRLSLPLAARGVPVWGIDASNAMVARLRAKPGGDAIPVAIGDMADVDLRELPGGGDARFAVVLLACNTLFNLSTAADQARCLQGSSAVLAPGGCLVIEAAVPDPDPPLGAVEVRTVEIDRVVLNVSRREPTGDAVRGQLVEITEAGTRLRPWVVRPVGPDDIDAMARAAGLQLTERWADWQRTPFTDADPLHVSVYRKPEDRSIIM
ncbi:MAG: class I SAM-dependent methyltransferase [Acidimicrobiales bacterium]